VQASNSTAWYVLPVQTVDATLSLVD